MNYVTSDEARVLGKEQRLISNPSSITETHCHKARCSRGISERVTKTIDGNKILNGSGVLHFIAIHGKRFKYISTFSTAKSTGWVALSSISSDTSVYAWQWGLLSLREG
jgi:hypothetical protein